MGRTACRESTRSSNSLEEGQASIAYTSRCSKTSGVVHEIRHKGRNTKFLNRHFFESIVVAAKTSLYPEIGDAALGDEAPENLF